jgi:hypothetical protein
MSVATDLIINLLLEEDHLFSRKLLQQSNKSRTFQELFKTLVAINKVLRCGEDALAICVNLFIVHPSVWLMGKPLQHSLVSDSLIKRDP